MSGHELEGGRKDGEAPSESSTVGTNRVRRRLTAGGLAGAGVLMTLPTRSALGQTVGMCGSESASAALSRGAEATSCGCSPGFWWNPNGMQVWAEHLPAEYAMTASFNGVFCNGLPAERRFFRSDDVTLLQAKGDKASYPPTNYDCGGVHAIGMHAVAALLNAEFYGLRYPPGYPDGSSVIAAFQAALQMSDACGSLRSFKDSVDIYDDAALELWCFNGRTLSSE